MRTLIHADAERRERQSRLTAAFIHEGIASSGALQALMATVYRQLPEPLAHAHRVALVSLRIGQELGAHAQLLDDLQRAAWVHDLGKLVLPDARSGDLSTVSQDDLACWSEQLRITAEIVGHVPFLARAADIVLASRECFDGSGFPVGLRGHAIPLGARVLRLADTYDALTAMCTALAVSAEAANVELVRHAGSIFDPDVVAAWLRCADAPPAGADAPPPDRGRHA